MNFFKKNINGLLFLFLVSVVFLSLNVVPVSFGAVVNDSQVHVPLVIDLSYVVAGVQFSFEYSAGFKFVSYEKSAVVSSALTTPVMVKSGHTYLGFYTADNVYVPTNGKLDVGYLVFNCLTDDSQQVTLTEIKLVQIVDDGATRNAFLAPVEITVSPGKVIEVSSVGGGDSDASGALLIDDRVSSVGGGDSDASLIDAQNLLVDASEDSWLPVSFWGVFVFLFVVACGAIVFIIVKKRVGVK